MGTHPIFESDFDCLTDFQIIMSSSKIPCEICIDTTEVRSYQTFVIRAKLQMTTQSNLEDLKLDNDCSCEVKDACPEMVPTSSSSSSSSDDEKLKKTKI